MGTSASVILALIAQYGIPAAETIFNDVNAWAANKKDPVASDWAALAAKVGTPYSYFVPTMIVPVTTSAKP